MYYNIVESGERIRELPKAGNVTSQLLPAVGIMVLTNHGRLEYSHFGHGSLLCMADECRE